MRRLSVVLIMLAAFCVKGWAAEEKGLVAHWEFDEGKGEVLHDRSGNENHGKIHGAKWVRIGKAYALQFDGTDDYVDCGTGPSLDITGPMTLEAWIYPESAPKPGEEPGIVGKFFTSYALTYYTHPLRDAECYWYMGHSGNHCKLRIDTGSWSHVVGTFDGNTIKVYVNGETVCSKKSRYKTLNRGKNFLMGCIIGDPTAQEPFWRKTAHFEGMIDEVRVYTRALLKKEIVRHYSQEAESKGRGPVDTSWIDRFKLTPYFYFDVGKVIVDVNFQGLLPLPKGADIRAELAPSGGKKSLQRDRIKALPEPGNAEVSFTLTGLPVGEYEIRAILADKTGVRYMEKLTFHYPPPSPEVPSTDQKLVPPLPPVPKPLRYRFELCKAGGFKITLKGESYPIESWYSYPHGRENKLLASPTLHTKGEISWTVATERISADRHTVHARGRYYTIDRSIRLHPNRISIKDTISNNTAEDIGIIVHNHLNTGGSKFAKSRLAGWRAIGRREGTVSPSAFIGKKGLGIGLVPLDDVYVVQSCVYFENNLAGISTDKFGLAGNASYTLEWAVYLNRTGDYYDFINAVRKAEGRNRKIDGGFCTISPRQVPSREYVELRSLKYCFFTPRRIADDPGISLDGIEFMDFPKEMRRIREYSAAINELHPQLKVLVHVAHPYYATNKPDRIFPDSRIIDKEGRHVVEMTNVAALLKWFSKERLEEGWNFYAFYPALDNSFHQAMLKSVDVAMDEMGLDGFFMDGLLGTYGGLYTYDGRWDGHTVQIDPETKTIKRKMASLRLISQPALIEFVRKVKAKGGVVVADNCMNTRSITKEDILFTWEVVSGPYLHLAPHPVGRGNPRRIKNELDVYRDVLDKLKWGMLYFYYGEKGITHKSVPSQMYPITIEEIHSGYVKGKERLVTMHSGVYGWRDDRDLHFAYRYDGRGVPVPHDFLTTVDAEGVRTDIVLKKSECAVLKKIPITLRSRSPINLVVQQYDAEAIQLVLNGRGNAEVEVRDGDFRIRPGASYVVKANAARKVIADKSFDPEAHDGQGRLLFKIALDGQVQVKMEPVEG